jgi:DNA-binding CsgD family transcriptional regulator
VITVGRSPRPDIIEELAGGIGDVQCDEFATFDDVPAVVLAKRIPAHDEAAFFVRLDGGHYAVVSVAFVEQQVARLLARVDNMGYHLIVVAATALFAPLRTATPIIHGQRGRRMGLGIDRRRSQNRVDLPLPRQGDQLATFGHRTQLQSAHASITGGYSERLTEVADAVADSDLIVMHSVGYTKAMAQLIAHQTGKPTVTARRIIGAAIQLRLGEVTGRSIRRSVTSCTGAELLTRLPRVALTPGESEVLIHTLEGGSNKAIARHLNISHRTVEIHRSRAMAKLGATSVTQLIRQALATGGAAHLAPQTSIE